MTGRITGPRDVTRALRIAKDLRDRGDMSVRTQALKLDELVQILTDIDARTTSQDPSAIQERME